MGWAQTERVWLTKSPRVKLKIHEVVHDAARSKAVVYAVSRADTPFGDWTNEYAVFFTFDESGQRIAKIEEMVDSAFLNDFFPKFQNFLKEQQQQGVNQG